MDDATTPTATHAVGIDLGTTHCALAYARLDRPHVRLMAIPQLVAPGELAAAPLLPSFLYLPASEELTAADRALPWAQPDVVVGEAARRLGAKVPARLVASAKSWVCHGGVDRRAPILPWNAPESLPHVSPYAAQVEYLAHLRAAWDHEHEGAPLERQDVVVTVPASFDEGARELTAAAAREAGLGEVRLLEEPQAAFYDWLGAHEHDVDAQLGDAKLILVIDVGGGTTDLTLLRVRDRDDEGARIERIAVGGHLMLGGDNMDAALAMFALGKAGLERPEDATTWSALVQSARVAKERLLGAEPPAQATLTMPSRGSRLVAGSTSITVERDEAVAVLLDGFVPRSDRDQQAARVGRAGLTTLGLPFTSDTAIVRHVCTFLRRHAAAAAAAGAHVDGGLPRPDRVLLNGGVFNAPALVQRLCEVLSSWWGAEPVTLLEHTSLDLAVAHGAVRSILARRGLGQAIGGGTARAYYIGVDGRDGKQALCVAPRAMEPGGNAAVPDRTFELVLDRPVAFPLFGYTGDRVDAPGTVVALDDELEPLPALTTVLRDPTAGAAHRSVPVTLRTSIGDTGALEIDLVTVTLPPRRWRLDFALHRPAPSADETSVATTANDAPVAPQVPQARERLERALQGNDAAAPKQLRGAIEALLGPRGTWSAATCRALADRCLELAPTRDRSEAHELNWMRVLGWCLRPGFGMDGDDARIDRMLPWFDEGPHHRSKANWAEWWILWRRIAAGLSSARQRAAFDVLRPWLLRDADAAPPPGPHKHGPIEMLQLAATLDRIAAVDKVALGERLLQRADKLGSYWPLGRVGARVPLSSETGGDGEDIQVVDPAVAQMWVHRLLALDLATAEGATFALASIARCTGDARRDLPAPLRAEVAERLVKSKVPAAWIELVLRGAVLSEGDRGRMFGDSLPVGLRLS
ncbi:MAG: Hsp70 family protein [Deltaproteobacteria bacterium]|nr:Hsp70 family protein [Deltaproteobacteria bacterium]